MLLWFTNESQQQVRKYYFASKPKFVNQRLALKWCFCILVHEMESLTL